MSDNPFSEPDDSERTVIRPAPGGRRAAHSPDAAPVFAPAASPAFEPRGPAAPSDGAVGEMAVGLSPLVGAAVPLLQLLARLRNTLNQPDPGDLRERAVAGVREFEKRSRDIGVSLELLRPAHYALCASLDDVVLNTPWGSTGIWDARSLVSTFHQEVRSGERFFNLLRQMCQNPGTFLPVIELMYLCMSLGFQGQYRLSARGPAELDRLREEVYTLLVRQRQQIEPELSPHWRGVAAPYRSLRPIMPLWVVVSAALAVLAALFIWFTTSLASNSDDLFARMLRAPPDHMPQIARAPIAAPAPPTPVAPPPEDELCALLKPEVDQGLVTVICTPPNIIIRINNRGMFPSGSATVEAKFLPLLSRIGADLDKENGTVQVIGYTDNQPIHTIQFPSNFQLSAARADAAKAFLAASFSDPSRITAEGRGEADPLNKNSTPEEREQNRRIEINLQRRD